MQRPDLQPLSKGRHGTWGWRPGDLGATAAAAGLVPVGLTEAPQLAATLPLVFRRVEGRVMPFVLVKAAGAEASPLVTAQGAFRGTCPVALATAPFVPGPDGRLWLDEGSPLITRSGGGTAFFGPDGPTAPVRAAQAVLSPWAGDRRRAINAATALAAEALLIPLDHRAAGRGLLRVDPVALDGLGAEALARLQARGALGLAWAHRVSLAHLVTLAHHAAGAGGGRAEGLLDLMTVEAARLAEADRDA